LLVVFILFYELVFVRKRTHQLFKIVGNCKIGVCFKVRMMMNGDCGHGARHGRRKMGEFCDAAQGMLYLN
jgi:hypothetical protein